MPDDNRWNERDHDWRDERGRGRNPYRSEGYGAQGEGGEERWRRMRHDRRHEGPAGYNDSGPAQGGWQFGDPEQGGERGQGYERYGYGRGPERSFQPQGAPGGREYGRGGDYRAQQPHYERGYGYGPYTPEGYRGRNEYDARGRGGYGAQDAGGDEHRSWIERAGERVASFFGAGEGGEHRGRGPKGYKRSDERIREDVNDRMTDDPWLDASQIEVQVKACEVVLTGAVNSREDKRRAEMLAESVSGVDNVQNSIRVEQQAADQTYGMTSQSTTGRTTGENGERQGRGPGSPSTSQ